MRRKKFDSSIIEWAYQHRFAIVAGLGGASGAAWGWFWTVGPARVITCPFCAGLMTLVSMLALDLSEQ